MWKKVIDDKVLKRTVFGIVTGLLLIILALIVFSEISFFIAGVAIMIIGFSFLYYLAKKWK